ncbi:hypothetical protein SAMN05443253_103468 [Bacillus sp. OK048]|nr:hypothetical protein SAMN05443253_103468 [Bacillus sp. OK048]
MQDKMPIEFHDNLIGIYCWYKLSIEGGFCNEFVYL